MKFLIFDHSQGAWINHLRQPVKSIFSAAVFDSREAAQGHFYGRTWDWEICPWKGE